MAKRSWLVARQLLRPIQRGTQRSVVLLGTSDLALAYCRELVPSLAAAGQECEVLDLADVRQQFGLSLTQARQLSGSRGAAVSFDHGRWMPSAPEVKLPHGLTGVPRAAAHRRPTPKWTLAPRNLLMPDGSPRYAAIGLSSHESIEQLLKSVPEIDPERVHLVGDIRADRLLSALKDPDSGKIGVFSGWHRQSLMTRAGASAPDLLVQFMRDVGATRAVLTYHPRVRLAVSNWESTLKRLAAIEGVSIIPSDNWAREFADCEAFLGDYHTSLFDVLAYTGRPIFGLAQNGSTRFELLRDGDAQPHVDWTLGEASVASVNLIRSVMSGR
jgi:hypothetical protein